MITYIVSSLADIGKVVIPITISVIVGNYLVQRWQQRNWRQQQLLLRGEKDIEALKLAIDELMNLADSRSYRSRRLLLHLRSNQSGTNGITKLDAIEAEYVKSVVGWNDKFNSLCARLTMYAPSQHAETLESNIQPQFVEISRRLEYLLKSPNIVQHAFESEKARLVRSINSFNGSVGRLYKVLIRDLKQREELNYLGRQIEFNEYTLDNFSTWQLTKALFKPQQPSLTIFGPPRNFGSPMFLRD